MKRFLVISAVLASCLLLSVAAVGCRKVEKPKPAPSTPTSTTTEEGTTATATVPAKEDPEYVAAGTMAAIARGIDYLKKTQLADGGWPATPDDKKGSLAITTVVAHGLLVAGLPPSDPHLQKAVDFVVSFAKEDGKIADQGLENYTTSISIMVLKAMNDPKYEATIKKALEFLRMYQWDEGEGLGAESADFGGAGYGKEKRPDLSNTQWFIEAIRKTGYGPDDPALKKAVIFVSRTQSGSEEARWLSLPDGSFIYSPHGEGESKAGTVVLPSGKQGLKGYGSMTYAGFLSLIYCGLDHNDKRVQAALGWIQKNWTFEENPGLGMEGYFYYLMTMGKALKAYGATKIVDDKGVAHDWQQELSAKLVALQEKDGSWANKDKERWYEGNPFISTPFALIGLSTCTAKL